MFEGRRFAHGGGYKDWAVLAPTHPLVAAY